MTPILQVLGLAAAVLGTGAATVSVMNSDVPDMAVPDADWAPSTALDGRAFSIVADLDTSDAPETDVLLFRDGQFQSTDCEDYCNFGWTDYQTWTETEAGAEIVHFTVTTRCPTAPHTVVWVGQVMGDEIEVEMSWTTRRWYWTHQIMGTATGQITEHDATGDAVTG